MMMMLESREAVLAGTNHLFDHNLAATPPRWWQDL